MTTVCWSNKGYYIAFGDDKSGLKIIGWSPAENDWVIKYENANLLNGVITGIKWSEDDKSILVTATGGTRAVAIKVDNGAKAGEINGHTADVLCCDFHPAKPARAILSGQDMEIQMYKGIPLKLEKSLPKTHTGFVNQIGYTKTDAAAHFVTVSGDKTMQVFDTVTGDQVLSQGCEHTQGINDICFTQNENEVVTCSSDRTTRVHRIDFENKALEHKTVLNISDFDTNGYKDNVEKQQLGLLYSDAGQEIMTVNLHSDINVWNNAELQEKPNKTLRGHCNAIKAITIFNGSIPVTGCLDGRLLSWDTATGMANRVVGHYKHKIGVVSLTCNSKFVYSFAGDQTAMVYEMKESPEQTGMSLCSVLPDFIRKHASVLDSIATEEVVYLFYHDKSIQMLKADNIEEVLKDSGKLEGLGDAKGEAACFTVSPKRNEMLIGDDKGFAHFYDASTLTKLDVPPIKTQHGHPIHSLAFSNDGTKFAIGDAKGYISIFDCETKAQLNYNYGHKNKVLQCYFTPNDEWVCSLSFDQILGLSLVADPKGSRKLLRPSAYAFCN